jgi:hypothetical protein
MNKQSQLTIRLDPELYERAKVKCKRQFGISLSPLIKVFLKSFVSQRGIGFYVGDDDLCVLFNRWIVKKRAEIGRKGCAAMPGPRLKDIYELKEVNKRDIFNQ